MQGGTRTVQVTGQQFSAQIAVARLNGAQNFTVLFSHALPVAAARIPLISFETRAIQTGIEIILQLDQCGIVRSEYNA